MLSNKLLQQARPATLILLSVRVHDKPLAMEVVACGWVIGYQLVVGALATARRYMDALPFDETRSSVTLPLLCIKDSMKQLYQ